VALRLKELGLEEAYALEGGYDAWKAAGGAIEPASEAQAAMTPP